MMEEDSLISRLVHSKHHLWCASDRSLLRDWEEALLLFATKMGRSDDLMARMDRELSECRNCIRSLHVFLESDPKDTSFEYEDFYMVVELLELKTVARLKDALTVDVPKIKAEHRVTMPMINALVEVLNYPHFLEWASLFQAVEAFLEVVLADARVSFPQKDRCGGVLLLCSSSVMKVRLWACEHVSKLNPSSTPDDLERVLDPAVQVLLRAVEDGRTYDSRNSIRPTESTDGKVIFEMESLFSGLALILSLVTPEILLRYASTNKFKPTFRLLIRTLFQRIDDSQKADERLLRCLSGLLKATTPELWESSEMWSFLDALEMLFAKAVSSYADVSKVGMESLLLCIQYICASAPTEQRSRVQDQAIQFLLCEFPKVGGNKTFIADAERVTVFIIGAACKVGILPVRTEPLWARPLLALALSHNGPCSVLEWVLKQVNDGVPRFVRAWEAVLGCSSSLPSSLHVAIWKGHSLFTDSQSPEVQSTRDLLAGYVRDKIPVDSMWLAQAVVYLFPMMIASHSRLLAPEAHRFFAIRVSGDSSLVRETLNGFCSTLEKSPPGRSLLGLVLKGFELIFGSAKKLNMSLTSVSDVAAKYLCKMVPGGPALTENTAKNLAQVLMKLAVNCTREVRETLHLILAVLQKAKGMTPSDLQPLESLIPKAPRVLPASVTDPVKKVAPLHATTAKAPVAKAAPPKVPFSTGTLAPPVKTMTPSLGQIAASIKAKEPVVFAPKGPLVPPPSATTTTKAKEKVRRSILPAAGTLQGISSTPPKELVEKERKKQRLLPSRTALYERVLGWSLDAIAKGEPDPDVKLLDVPRTFSSDNHYCMVFEPLLLAEVRAAIERDLEDFQDRETFHVRLGQVQRKDPLMMLSFKLHNEKADVVRSKHALREAFQVDDLVELISPAGDLVLCMISSIDWNQTEKAEEVKLIACPPSSSSIKWVPFWKCKWVSSVLITASREWRSMMSIPHLPIRDYILRGVDRATLSQVLPKPPLLSKVFNESQVSAISRCLSAPRGFVLIQGPPGTGKTKTILGIVGSILFANRDGGAVPKRRRLLVCAASNRAVDEVASRLMGGVWDPFRDRQEEISVVRIGRSDAASAAVQEILLDTLAKEKCSGRVQRSDDQAKQSKERIVQLSKMLEKLDAEITELGSKQVKSVQTRNDSGPVEEAKEPSKEELEVSAKLGKLYEQKREARQMLKKSHEIQAKAIAAKDFDFKAAKNDVLTRADVVCATLSAAGTDTLINLDLEFDAVIVDEATQATELQTLIPLKYRSKVCVLVGDPKQLPATVLSKAAAAKFYHQSLFQRLEALGTNVTLLNTQYRMHPKISEFPNRMFYEGLLRNGPNVTSSKYLKEFHDDGIFAPFTFIDTQGSEQRGASNSAMNEQEATLAVDILADFFKRYGQKSATGGIGIITPYRRQMLHIKSLVQPRLERSELDLVDINTIDGFQGCEKDLIIFSCVRSHSGSSIGFLDDVRRLNVALTRARFCLIVLGNARLLRQHEAFEQLISYAKETGSLKSELEVRDAMATRDDNPVAKKAKAVVSTTKLIPPKPAVVVSAPEPAMKKIKQEEPRSLFLPPRPDTIQDDIIRNRQQNLSRTRPNIFQAAKTEDGEEPKVE